jgi:tetratricopeptide (TPR) repeat protein
MAEALAEAEAEADRPGPDDSRAKALLQVAVTEAFACFAAGATAKACAHLDEVQHLAAVSDTASYVFGLFYFNIGDPTSALAWFAQAIRLNASHLDARKGRALALQRLGRMREALAAFEGISRDYPSDAEAAHMSGIILQNLGKPDAALAAYDRALRIKPDYCEALCNRGALFEQAGLCEEALKSFDAVIALHPEAINFFNRGCVLQKLGRFEAALADHEAATRLDPTHPENEVNRGNVLQKLGRHAESLASYDKAIHLRPDYPQALYNRAIARQKLGRPAEAIVDFDAALAQKPDYPEALCNRGNVLSELGRLTQALASYDRALALRPDFQQAQINRANVLFALGRVELARDAAADILTQDPTHAQALCICGVAHQRLGDLDSALCFLDRAVAARPDYAEAWLNRGNVLQEQDRLDDALASYDRALTLRPAYPEVLSSRGVALKELGRLDEAMLGFDAALRLKPNYPDARNNRAGALLLKGDLQRGFVDFESRWDRSNAPAKTFISPLPHWRGELLEGKKILVWDEQGLGDLIQFCRYLPLLESRGAEVTLLCRKSMFRLLSTLPAPPHFVETPPPEHVFAYQSALMSLPHAFGTTLASVPAGVPYLHAEPGRVATWATRLDRQCFRIGICWHGNLKINLKRNVPLECFGPLAAIPGVHLISLMKEAVPPDSTPVPFEFLGADFDGSADAFLDTAAVMANCDLIVTSDTSIAHLAGALGRPVFLVLRHAPDWRWLATGSQSPWYPTMRLFRQKQCGAWEPVFAEIAEAVGARDRLRPILARIKRPRSAALGTARPESSRRVRRA